MAVSYCAKQKRQAVNVLTPVWMVQKGQQTPGRPVLRTRLLRRGLRPPGAGDEAGASLTLSDSITGHRDPVIDLRAEGRVGRRSNDNVQMGP